MTTALARGIPRPHFGQHHARHIDADPAVVWAALARVTMGDLSVARSLMAVRHLRAPPPRGEIAAPLLTSGPVTMLSLTSPSYAVGGAVMRPWQLDPQRHPITSVEELASFAEPGWVKVLTDFSLTAEGDGTRLATDTRVVATDRRTRVTFGAYWWLIRPFAGFVRRDILRAVDRLARAESSGDATMEA